MWDRNSLRTAAGMKYILVIKIVKNIWLLFQSKVNWWRWWWCLS